MAARRSSRPRLLLAAAGAASTVFLCPGFSSLVAFNHALGRTSWPMLGSRSQASWRSLRRADADAMELMMETPPLDEADEYNMNVDVISGEIDISVLPEEMGVYAIYDSSGRLQYIGLSRQIQKSVENHAKSIGLPEVLDLISTVRCVEMPGESKELLKETWEGWIKEHMANGGEIPAGNLPENAPGADPRWRSRSAQAKPSLSLGGVGGIVTPAEALAAVRRAVEENPVILFMKGTPAMPQCGFSARTSGLLREIGVPFETVNVLDNENNPGVRDAVKEFGNWPTIPQLYVSGQLVGGADIVMEMHQTGQLEQALKSAAQGQSAAGSAETGSAPAEATAGRGNVRLIDDPRRPTATALCKALDSTFTLVDLRVADDSAAHEGDAGALEMGLTSESHFSVEIVAPEFAGLMPVQRQQKVYEALSQVMPKIHALSLVTRTPAEVADAQ
eukprot:gb/GFBE01004379.1/.p1 GENE.gb/GFBE01004379.1/~~gb/GFBE01004379.1/.p1  ORF type:complete len:447 (+),score=82.72 gb/GFBE01004379.1/:1-1341(+)